MRIAPAGVSLLAAAGLAACGATTSTVKRASSSGGASPAATSRHVTTRTVTRTAIAPTSPSGGAALSTVTGTVTGPATPPCTAADLHLSFLGQQGATGHGELGFALRNTSGTACETVGYPGVQFLDTHGDDLPTTPTHATSDFFGRSALRTLTVVHGDAVSFRLAVNHIGSHCTIAHALQVIVPNDTATQRTAISGGASECDGAATVSPLQPGDSAYP